MHDRHAKPSDFLGLGAFSSSDGDGVGTLVEDLAVHLTSAVPSFVGLTVTLVDDDGELTLVATAAAPAGEGVPPTSLRFCVVPAAGRSARFVLHARQPGALVDLAADLDYLARGAGGQARAPTDVRLDEDLDGTVLVPGVVGLGRRSALHRAEGVLIADGVDPREVAAELRRRAVAHGADLDAYARRTLEERSTRDPPQPRPGPAGLD